MTAKRMVIVSIGGPGSGDYAVTPAAFEMLRQIAREAVPVKLPVRAKYNTPHILDDPRPFVVAAVERPVDLSKRVGAARPAARGW